MVLANLDETILGVVMTFRQGDKCQQTKNSPIYWSLM